MLNKIDYSTKFGGAVGNMNAHYVACPEVDWITFANNFAIVLGLSRNKYTTQIDHYDNYARIFDNLRRINVILIDLSRDVWMYISQNYFSQKIHQNEVGSSAMPHKVNPINFENAEGNLMLANSLFDFMSNKLPISRLQRDLTDSTVLRNVGVSFAHTLTSIKSLVKGFNRIDVNMDMIQSDLGNNWMVIAEAIQTILRRSGYVNAYDALKNYTRVETNMTKEKMDYFINNLQIDNVLKEKLLSITPYNYYGYIV
jgi:adenylosuccinate lyase